MISTGIRVTEAIIECVVSYSDSESSNNNDYNNTEREKIVIDLYNQGKTRCCKKN
ncbi:MAG TPA: hypothetical protein VI278_11030 [Nitrososphaeraceae archaeon]